MQVTCNRKPQALEKRCPYCTWMDKATYICTVPAQLQLFRKPWDNLISCPVFPVREDPLKPPAARVLWKNAWSPKDPPRKWWNPGRTIHLSGPFQHQYAAFRWLGQIQTSYTHCKQTVCLHCTSNLAVVAWDLKIKSHPKSKFLVYIHKFTNRV